MRQVSDAFLRSLRGSHRPTFEATVCDTFQTGANPTGLKIPIVAGDVRLDGDADIRSTLDLTTTGDRWPRYGQLALAPYGNEIYIRRGIQYSDDLIEWVGLGYHRIRRPEQDITPDGDIRISATDRMATLIRARMLAPRPFAAGTTLGTVVSTLVLEVYPQAVIEWDDDTHLATLTRPTVCEDDRYLFLRDLFTARGKIMYWDHRGVLVIRTPPDPSTPVWDVSAGTGGVLVEMSRLLDADQAYNAVVAIGSGADTEYPARGVAVDANPNSPTHFWGRFGPAPRYYTSPFLATDNQAMAAARVILMRYLGLPYTVDFSTIPNPGLEPWDAVRVNYSHRHSAETHVLRTLTIPLTPDGDMRASTREQTVTLIGAL